MLFKYSLIAFSFSAKDEMLLPHAECIKLTVADYILSTGLVFLFQKEKQFSITT